MRIITAVKEAVPVAEAGVEVEVDTSMIIDRHGLDTGDIMSLCFESFFFSWLTGNEVDVSISPINA
jgi:hypothetical protein